MLMFRYVTTIFLFFIPIAYAMEKENLFDELPLELHSKIIKNVFSLIIREDDDSDEHRAAINKFFGRTVSTEHIDPKKLDQYVLHIPIPLGIIITHQFHQLQKLCEQKIGDKNFVARELFLLPHKQRDVFMRIANRSFVECIGEGDISIDDYNTLVAIENKDMIKGLRLRVFQGNKAVNYMRSVGVINMGMSWALFLCGGLSGSKILYFLVFSGIVSCCGLHGVASLLEMCGYKACVEERQIF